MPLPTPRRLKVAAYYKRLYPRLAITSLLTLRGDWLAAAGFLPGATATVEIHAGRLVITTS